jgi:hypothetical protein
MLSNETFYDLSGSAGELILKAKKLTHLHIMRYKLLVDTSAKAHDCTYAKLTKRYFLEELSQERETLAELANSINILLESIDASLTD